MPRPSRPAWATLLAVLPLLPAAAAVPSRYTVEPLAGWFDASTTSVAAMRINNAGQVAGIAASNGTSSYFLYDGKTVQRIPGGTPSGAPGLNDQGNVVGTLFSDGTYQGFVYGNGTVQTLPGIMPSAINNAGQIVGVSTDRGFLNWGMELDHGVTTDFGPNGGEWSTADAINVHGEVAGTTALRDFGKTAAFIVLDTMQYQLPGPAGGSLASRDINDAGVVVGQFSAWGTPATSAFYYHLGKVDLLPSPGGFGEAVAINDNGAIVGGVGMAGEAALWQDGQLYLLSDLLADAGWSSLHVSDINDSGQMVGSACRADTCEAVLFDPVSPVPEPAAWAMLALGLAPLLRARART
jgi:uncharacterized membrane protein